MTFLVVSDFILNAQLLDDQRLAKQRVEGMQILNTILRNADGWKNHPIVRSWYNYPDALKYYVNCIILEFIRRGGNNNIQLYDVPSVIIVPWWVHWDRLHQSHRAMLMRKNPFYYNNKFTVDPEYNSYGYIWPYKVPYCDRDKPLSQITDPIPEYLTNPVYCTGILKSGVNAGKLCTRLVKDKHTYCTIHRRNN